jgi:hypothetical protein
MDIGIGQTMEVVLVVPIVANERMPLHVPMDLFIFISIMSINA